MSATKEESESEIYRSYLRSRILDWVIYVVIAVVFAVAIIYEIAHTEHRQIEDECDEAGLEIVGYYHSHPDHGSYASIRDSERAWPDSFYLIVSCMAREIAESKVFVKPTWTDKKMVEVALDVVEG